MGYQALYRKFRPIDFKDLVGQEHIVRTLTNQIEANRTTHAYLFTGTRGTGKTSAAKIFARAVNCEKPVDGSPCNKCENCKKMLKNQSLNVIEIDAASNNGVDNIREIREAVMYAPTEGRYKVYIIDEVHMLSTGAFNALLKTLEEPPEYVKFILATTEPHKIPATILSRCQRYDFKRISTEVITDTLEKYLKEEKVVADHKAVRYIAKIGDGSMRDALSVLDQCIAFYLGETITLERVLEVLGAVDTDIFNQITAEIIEKDTKKIMMLIDKIVTEGRDLNQFLLDEINYLRDLLITISVENSEELLDVSNEVYELLKSQAKTTNESQIVYLIRTLSELQSNIKYMQEKRTLIEIELIKLCNDNLNLDLDALLARVANLETKLKNGVKVREIVETKVSKQTKKDKEETEDNNKIIEYAKAIPEDIKAVMKNWIKVVGMAKANIKAVLMESHPYSKNDGALTIVCPTEVHKNDLNQEASITKLNEILQELFEKDFEIVIVSEKELLSKSNVSVQEVEELSRLVRKKMNLEGVEVIER